MRRLYQEHMQLREIYSTYLILLFWSSLYCDTPYFYLLVRLGLPPTEWVQSVQKSRDHGGSSSTSIPGSNEMALYRRSVNTNLLQELEHCWSAWMWTWGNVLCQPLKLYSMLMEYKCKSVIKSLYLRLPKLPDQFPWLNAIYPLPPNVVSDIL